MPFSCKIILSNRLKSDGTRMVYLQAIIDRQRAVVPLGFYLRETDFDARSQCTRAGHPNKKNFDTEFMKAAARAAAIASRYRIEDKRLSVESFRKEYTNPSDKMDLIGFIKKELEFKRPSIANNTYKQHNTVVRALEGFARRIYFHDISIEMMQRFRNHLLNTGNSQPTVNKKLKIVKQYLADARKKDIEFRDPFRTIKIRNYTSNRLSLSQAEVDKLDHYYDHPDCPPAHHKLLRYFLFSCYTGVRISDVKLITFDQIHDDLLVFTPVKTKAANKQVTVPLTSEKKYLPAYHKGPIFETFADPVSNRYLKDVARECGIKKKITYHTSRHTFGSLFAEGGNIVALQRIMGHGDIKTTMGYVHTSVTNLVEAKHKRFPVKGMPAGDGDDAAQPSGATEKK